jgi:hypothetical protein
MAWSIFAVGGVYLWAGVPLLGAAVALALGARPRVAGSSETRGVDTALVLALAATAFQLVPLPGSARALITPHADTLRSALLLSRDGTSTFEPISVAPWSTAYGLGLIATAMVVFWTARQACGQGATRFLVRAVAFVGLIAALAALVQKAGNPELIYGHWVPRDAGARPFGPFVNRNHFAAWVVMAVPLATGYVGAALTAHRPASHVAGAVAAALRSLGSGALWTAVSVAVMTLALVTSTSRSGLLAFGISLAGAVWIGRGRLTTRVWIVALLAASILVLFVGTYGNLTPLMWRLEETLLVGAGDRPQIWQETWTVIRDFWLTGTGLGTYQPTMLIYQQTDRGVFINQAHNQYLHLFAEGGLLLIIPAAASVIAFIRLFRIRLARDTSPSAWLRIGGAAALVAIAVQGLWETGLRMPANGILFALAAAVAVHRPVGREKGSDTVTST